jgi:predicted transcriptional regulator
MSSEESDRPGRPADTWDEPLKLTDPKAMRALAHPVRMALLDLIAVAGTLTATQASEALGESPANCAFHLRTLAKYGFVREAGGGRGRERPWTRTRRTISISSTEQDNAQAAIAAGALGSVYFERWVERARRVFGSGERLPGWENATQMSRSAVFLTAEEAVQVGLEMREIIDRYRGRERDLSQRPADGLPVEVAFFTSPLTEFSGVKPVGESQDIS